MKRHILLAAVLSILAITPALGQSGDWRGAGYGYAAFGGVANTNDSDAFWQFGAGGEVVFSNGLGFQADVGALTPSGFDDAVGVFTPSLLFEVKPQNDTTAFLDGGYALFFRDGTANGFYFGGGVRHWFNDGFGIRFEVRDQVFTEGDTVHFVMGRISFLFR